MESLINPLPYLSPGDRVMAVYTIPLPRGVSRTWFIANVERFGTWNGEPVIYCAECGTPHACWRSERFKVVVLLRDSSRSGINDFMAEG